MSLRRLATLLLPLGLLALSCASPTRLAHQSDEALARGDLRTAYEKARRALDKDASNVNARTSFAAAARQMGDDFKSRVMLLAQADTIAAARMALDYRDFRREVARYPVQIDDDVAYLQHESEIVRGAAAIRYADGEQSLADARPKDAYRRFTESERFDSDYRDVAKRADDAYQRALTRVAVVPFQNSIHVAGLPQFVQQRITAELSRRSGSPAFQFTRVFDQPTVDDQMTVTQALGLSRDQARALGRTLGADRVVCGRLSGMKVNSDSHDYTFPVYRVQPGKDQDGKEIERWVESQLHVVARDRRVDVTVDYEVVDVRTGTVLSSDSHPFQSNASVVWTRDVGTGDPDDYHLVTPDLRRAEPARAKDSEQAWSDAMGSWTVPEVVGAARSQTHRERWDSSHRAEFAQECGPRPVFWGELPGEADLAFMALDRSWEPVLASLQRLDPND